MDDAPERADARTEPEAPDPASEAHAIFDEVARALRRDGPRIPGATYRVQLNRTFTFRDAVATLDYLDALGVTDLYASPFFRACPGSMHGYDLVDHNATNGEIGEREDLDALARELRRRNMGLVLDFVPNHMGIATPDNAWWMDVLENGPSSLYAGFFDIDWAPLSPALQGKVLLPVLGDHYGRVLEAAELRLEWDRDAGAFFVRYWDHVFPVNPRTVTSVLEPLVPGLSEALGAESEPVLELESIVTGLRNLPPRSERERAKVLERRREKEVLKRRLATLTQANGVVARAIEERVARMNGAPGDARSFDELDRLLEEQAYRLSYWRVAAEEINYRRFFDINELAAIRMEEPEVFVKAHRLLFELLATDRVTGLRIDHPDGLWDPLAYCEDLQRGHVYARCLRALEDRAPESAERPVQGEADVENEAVRRALRSLVAAIPPDDRALSRPLYVVVEKILARGEPLPEGFPIYGTSGYDFATNVGGLFVDRDGEAAISSTYARFVGHRIELDELVYEEKKLVLRSAMASELNVLATALHRLAERDRHSRDFTIGVLTDALREVIACFPVYRTYVTERTEVVAPHDRAAMLIALRLARRRNPTTDASVYEFIRKLLMLEVPSTVPDADRHAWRSIVMKLQQLTGPVMAKGLEDTAFYVFNRLVSLNEVGGEPERFGVEVDDLHRANAERQRSYPHAMLATSTHDTKRSEDVRARISVLSEVPSAWEATLESVASLAARFKVEIDGRAAPDRNEEVLLYQTILGTLPFSALAPGAPPKLSEEYIERIVRYMQKATKEAKVNTSWIDASPAYDEAVSAFVRGALSPEPLLAMRSLARVVAHHGMWGSLAQAVLKFASPGVPDTYQGTELWDDSLVDPDNRRPVDFEKRKRILAELHERADDRRALARELVTSAEDGRIKLYVTARALGSRRALPRAFGAESEYEPMAASGPASAHIVAFARRAPGEEVVVVVPRLTAKLLGSALERPTGAAWVGTEIALRPGRYEDVFTGVVHDASSGALSLASLFADFPVVWLVRAGAPA